MLQEIINFNHPFSIDMFIGSISDYPLHWHLNSLEIICVLEGSVIIHQGFFSNKITEGQVYIINIKDLHSISSTSESNTLLFCHIDLDHYNQIFENIKLKNFVCNSSLKENNQSDIANLRYMLSKIYLRLNSDNQSLQAQIEKDTKDLLSFLIENFQYFSFETHGNTISCINRKKQNINQIQINRMHRIHCYIYWHHSENLTLKDIAKTEYLSISYLSHFIKQTTGLTFQQLLSIARVEAAEKLLLDTNKTIDTIALNVGFSKIKYLSMYFKKWYGCTPSQYRRMNKNRIDKTEKNNKYLEYNKKNAYKKIQQYFYNVNKPNNYKTMNSLTNNFSESMETNLRDYGKLLILSGKIYNIIFKDKPDFSIDELLSLFVVNSESISNYNEFIETIFLQLESHFESNCANSTTAVRQTIK